LKIST